MTLGSWFRNYVYIPLGGNRHHLLRNTLVVWLLTGLWHGASWNFVMWGLFHFAFISLEKSGLNKVLERSPLKGHLYMAFLIPVSWLLFAVSDLGQLGLYFGRCFPFFGAEASTVFAGDFIKYAGSYGVSLFAALLFTTGLPEKFYQKHKQSVPIALALTLVFWACVYCMHIGMDDPFLYFQF